MNKNATFNNSDQHGCLQHRSEHANERLQHDADEAAVVDPGNQRSLSFAELHQQSSMIALYLLEERDAGCSKIVGVFMDKSCEYIASYTGTLKAGCAHLPLDFTSPDSMLCMTLEEAKPIAILTKSKYLKRLSGFASLAIELDGAPDQNSVSSSLTSEGKNTLNLRSSSNSALDFRSASCSLDDLAYVVYSSGTTGKPKGILCPHRGAVFSYLYRQKVAPFEPNTNERVACNIFFVWELLIPLLCGVDLHFFVEKGNLF